VRCDVHWMNHSADPRSDSDSESRDACEGREYDDTVSDLLSSRTKRLESSQTSRSPAAPRTATFRLALADEAKPLDRRPERAAETERENMLAKGSGVCWF
jgi:hypothetical protein